MKTINLKSNGIGWYTDVSPFIIADNKLEIKVGLPNLNGEFFLVAENNGKAFKKTLSRIEPVILEELTAGELQTEVQHYLKGELIKTYQVEPLILKEVNGSLSGTPELVNLQAQITALSNSVEDLEAKLNKKLNALIRFAYKDYQNNVYLSGGSFGDFIKEFGFELSEEEIKLIKGE